MASNRRMNLTTTSNIWTIILIVLVTFLSTCGGQQNDLGHHVQKHGESEHDHDHHTGHGKSKANSLIVKPGSVGSHIHGSGINDLDFSESSDHSNSNSPDDENDSDYESHSDESSPNGLDEWGKDFDKKDLTEITDIEKNEEKDQLWWPDSDHRRISKCCPADESLNSEGICKKSHVGDKRPLHHEVSWFPEKVYDIEKGNWTIPVQSDWEIKYGHSVKCPQNESSEIVFDINRFVILNNGRLYLSHHDKDVAPQNFCVDLLIGHGRAVRSCFTQSELCGRDTTLNCLRKCCPPKAMVQEPSGSCVVTPNKVQNNFPTDKWNIIHGTPECEHGQYFTEINEFHVGTDGGLNATSGDVKVNANFLDYCLDFFIETEYLRRMTENVDESKENRTKHSRSSKLKAMVCFKTEKKPKGKENGLIRVPKGVSMIFGCALILSAVCIALAALVSWRLAELRSLHGKCQLCHLATLFCLFIMLATVHLGSDHFLPGSFCTFLAVAIHMCALSAFLWLNLLCVNIYWTFRYLRPPLAARRAENKRLFFLCVYAWGLPAAFCLFLLILDSSEGRLDPMPRPGYGELACLISNRGSQFAYLFGPVGILLLLNGILFCLTAKELLCGLWRLDNSDSINFRRKSMGIVVGKMGIVMGMGWILDVLSWGVGSEIHYMFYAADLFNSLQGVFIFVVLIWRKRVLEILHLRKRSTIKDETVTAARPFLPKSSLNNTTLSNNGDADTSLVLIQDS